MQNYGPARLKTNFHKVGPSCYYFRTDKLALRNGVGEDLYAPKDLVVDNTTAAYTYLK